MLITFEGIDGSGKSTQIHRLKEYLEVQGYVVHLVREPGHTGISEAIRAILLNKEFHEMTDRTELLLFNAARAQLVERVIVPALDRGNIVLCDRFFDSTIAYQSFGRGIDLDLVRSCIAIATNGLVPHKTFYMRIPVDISIERSKAKHLDRMEVAGRDFFLRVINGYEYLCTTEPQRVIPCDGTRLADDIHQVILKHLPQFVQ
jgi:dTMP kinase